MALIGKIFQALRRTRDSVSKAFDTVIQRKVSPESLEELENTLILGNGLTQSLILPVFYLLQLILRLWIVSQAGFLPFI